MNFLDSIWLIPLFPAIGFLIIGLFGKRMAKSAIDLVGCGVVLTSFVFALGSVLQLLSLDSRSHTKILFQWINAGEAHTSAGTLTSFSIDWGFLLDPLSGCLPIYQIKATGSIESF